MLDYETLRLVWWALLGVLLIAFAITDGFDMGICILLPFLGKTDSERRVMINTVAPVWEANQVWLILGAGAIFAAWPPLYAVAFSGFYIPMFILLSALIFRPVAFKFRSKIANPLWRSIWDYALFAGGFIPALIFGVAVGNALLGVPFHFDEDLRITYTGTFLGLLSPFPIACGLISVLMMIVQGATYLRFKTSASFSDRLRPIIVVCLITILCGVAAMGIYTHSFVYGYRLVSSSQVPLDKEVIRTLGALAQNFYRYPWMIIVPGFVYGGAILCASALRRPFLSFMGSSLMTTGIIATVGVSLFPFLLPSSTHLPSSLTVWDASSSQKTLWIMLVAVVIFLPIILAYLGWLFRTLRGKVTEKTVQFDENSY